MLPDKPWPKTKIFPSLNYEVGDRHVLPNNWPASRYRSPSELGYAALHDSYIYNPHLISED
jgi:hypothetical protein